MKDGAATEAVEKKGTPPSVKLLDGALTLYKRPGSKCWWGGFYHRRLHIRTSTKTDNLEEAKQAARNWYFEQQLEIRNGFAPASKQHSFTVAADKALAEYKQDVERGERSKSYLRGLTPLFESLKQMIGKVAITDVNQAAWNNLRQKLLTEKTITTATLHQYKNALRVVLKQAARRGDIEQMPQFVSDKTGNSSVTPRTWFEPEEYRQLINALRANTAKHRREATRWQEAADELYDYALFVANSGLRVGEAMSVRFCDVELANDYDDFSKSLNQVLKIRNIVGKRGRDGQCKSYFGAVKPFMSCVKRAGLGDNWKQSEACIFEHYHRDMFREVLDGAKLRYTTSRPPRRRDLVSLRHTYICFRLLRNVPVYALASNCRTSVQMIEQHYARYLNVTENAAINRNPQAAQLAEEEQEQ